MFGYDSAAMGAELPLDGYIRVSQVGGRGGDRFQSPEQQRDAIEAWAAANGVQVGLIHEDLDESGGTMDRPGMRAALERVERGETGGLVVARLDRFARTLIGGLTTIEQLQERDARVVSVAEAVDPATPMGRAMLGLLLIMAQWQRDQADESFGVAQARAASAGRFPGRPPYGYRRTEDGRTELDPDTAPVVRRIFEARASGRGWGGIAIDLTRDGIRTSTGGERWAYSTISGIVRSEAYLGVFKGPRGLRVEEAWPAIVDRDLWERANAIRGVRDTDRRYQDRLLAGIARCAGCRQVLRRTVNPEGYVSYGCRAPGCPARASMGAEVLDGHVARLIDERLARLRLRAQVASDDDGEEQRLTTARDAAVRELEAWRDDLELRGVLGELDWREGMLARARARDDAETNLARHRAETGVAALSLLPDDVVPQLEQLPWAGRRRVVEALLHSVWVRRSEARGPRARQHVDLRTLVVWQDDPRPPDLPVRGSRRGRETTQPLSW